MEVVFTVNIGDQFVLQHPHDDIVGLQGHEPKPSTYRRQCGRHQRANVASETTHGESQSSRETKTVFQFRVIASC